MPIQTLQDLLADQLRDLFSVESQLIAAQAELANMASGMHLQGRLREHGAETRRQRQRLLEIAANHHFDIEGDPSRGMEGLLAGGRSHILEAEAPEARDFLIIAHCHRIEHYEMAGYAVAAALAAQLGLDAEAELLNRSLNEEREMDRWLTRLAAATLLEQIPTY